jgi:hypothetical protein
MKPIERNYKKRHQKTFFNKKEEHIPKGMRKAVSVLSGDRWGNFYGPALNKSHIEGILKKYKDKSWDDCYSHLCEVVKEKYLLKEQLDWLVTEPTWIETEIDLLKKIRPYKVLGGEKKYENYKYEVIGTEKVCEFYLKLNYYVEWLPLRIAKRLPFYRSDIFFIDENKILRFIPRVNWEKWSEYEQERKLSTKAIFVEYGSKIFSRVMETEDVNITTKKDLKNFEQLGRWSEMRRRLNEREKEKEKNNIKSEYKTIIKKVVFESREVYYNGEIHYITVEVPVTVQKRIKK